MRNSQRWRPRISTFPLPREETSFRSREEKKSWEETVTRLYVLTLSNINCCSRSKIDPSRIGLTRNFSASSRCFIVSPTPLATDRYKLKLSRGWISISSLGKYVSTCVRACLEREFQFQIVRIYGVTGKFGMQATW